MNHRIVTLMILAITLIGNAGMTAFAQNDIDEQRSCANCGMDRKAYGYSRMLVRYEDGSQVGVCSLHCAVIELDANKGRAVKSLQVADRDSRTLLEATDASWVMGGKKRGVMTQLPKWAFATKAAAQAFVADNGGKLASWDEVVAVARKEVLDTLKR